MEKAPTKNAAPAKPIAPIVRNITPQEIEELREDQRQAHLRLQDLHRQENEKG